MVDRYEDCPHIGMTLYDNGDYVRHEDYAYLEAENARLGAESHASHERGVRRVRDYLRSINRHAAANMVEREFNLGAEAAAKENQP